MVKRVLRCQRGNHNP